MKYLFFAAIFLGIICGIVFPQFGVLKPAIPFLIGFLLFLNFLVVKPEWKGFLRKELAVTVSLAALVMPLIAYHLLSLSFNHDYRSGLLLISLAPSGIIMLVLSRFVPHKDSNLILSNFFITTFGSIIYAPLVIKWLLGTNIQINVAALFLQTGALILTPYVSSLAFANKAPAKIKSLLQKQSNNIICFLAFVIIGSSISGAVQKIIINSELVLLSAAVASIYLIQGGLAYAFGLIFGDKSVRNSMCLIASSRNIQLMLAIAIINFPPAVVVPCILGIFFHHITNVFWLWLFRK